jgi:hypothetical protein
MSDSDTKGFSKLFVQKKKMVFFFFFFSFSLFFLVNWVFVRIKGKKNL